jgi:hypothetical protein
MGTNIVVEWLTLLLRIWEVPGSNIGPVTGYHVRFSWFSSVQENSGIIDYLKIGHDSFLQSPFQFLIHVSPFHSKLLFLVTKRRR